MKRKDKYIVEIAEVHTHFSDNGNPFKLGRVKGFSSLVFDEVGLSKMQKANYHIDGLELLKRMKMNEHEYECGDENAMKPSWDSAIAIIEDMMKER